MFFKNDLPFSNEFLDENARFGLYMSKDVFGGRLRLSIRPLVDRNTESVEFNFNFDYRITARPQAVEQIVHALQHWEEASEMAHRIVNAGEPNG